MTTLSSAVVMLPKQELAVEVPHIQSVVEVSNPVPTEIDRNSTCPILITCFISIGGKWNPLNSYRRLKNDLNKIEMNTWMDASLRELTSEIRDLCLEARKRGLALTYSIVYPDKHSSDYRRREIGKVYVGRNQRSIDGNTRLTDDSTVTLASKKFQVGDYLEVCINDESRPNNLNGRLGYNPGGAGGGYGGAGGGYGGAGYGNSRRF